MTGADASLIAALHAASWRTAYRGILSDAYLAGAVDAERAFAWSRRLDALDHTQFGLVATLGGAAVGFTFVVGNADPHWGCLIDNLHVATEQRSAGLGPQLLHAAADGIAVRGWDRRVHLFVYGANVRARAFYARMGGVEVETLRKPTPEGDLAKEWRVAWRDLDDLRRDPRLR